MTREEWLQKAIDLCRAHKFKPAGYTVPKVRVSVGLPYGRGAKKIIGQHWHPATSDDKVGSIFISPTINDTVQVLGTLVHEMVHAAVGNEAGHGPLFKKCALSVGLDGQMRATHAGKDLSEYFKKTIIKRLGNYPHARLNIVKAPIKKQSTRMIKLECTNCGFIARAAMTKILEVGPPLCNCNHEQMEIRLPGEE